MSEWLLDRLQEESTWKGVSLVAGMFGIILSPDRLVEIGTAVGIIYGAVDMIRKENPKT